MVPSRTNRLYLEDDPRVDELRTGEETAVVNRSALDGSKGGRGRSKTEEVVERSPWTWLSIQKAPESHKDFDGYQVVDFEKF